VEAGSLIFQDTGLICGRLASSFMFTVVGVEPVLCWHNGGSTNNLHRHLLLVVDHFHYVLSLGCGLLPHLCRLLFTGSRKLSGRMYNELLGQLHVWIFFIAVNILFSRGISYGDSRACHVRYAGTNPAAVCLIGETRSASNRLCRDAGRRA